MKRARQVFVAWLSDDEMQTLLQQIAAADFFEWSEAYTGEPVVDAASKCLTITLSEKTVCETHGGAPPAFYTLFDSLSQGADYSGVPFYPQGAYISGFRVDDQITPRPAAELTWEETPAQGSPVRILIGFWLEEGDTLRMLWDAANQNSCHMPIIEDGERLYRVILQVPGVNWIELSDAEH